MGCYRARRPATVRPPNGKNPVTRAPTATGRSFGNAGTYETITARATMAVGPADRHNVPIVDLDLAHRDETGRVLATTDVTILRPEHPNDTLLLKVMNRGRKLLPVWLNDTDAASRSRLTSAADAGKGFCSTSASPSSGPAGSSIPPPPPRVLRRLCVSTYPPSPASPACNGRSFSWNRARAASRSATLPPTGPTRRSRCEPAPTPPRPRRPA